MIDKDLNQIWSEIYKPEQFENTKPEDFFAFEFIMMPHKIFEPDAFTEKANELKGRFEMDAADKVFLDHGSNSQNVPLDGMPFFVERTWSVIRE